MTWVDQNPKMFPISIAENIAYGLDRDKINDEEIRRAAEWADIHTFIESLPKKYDTKLTGKSSGLSGGQLQRLALARALAREPQVLLLDEATSALDSESEISVKNSLEKIRAERHIAIAVIAHRLHTIKAADRIYVLQSGTIVESGTHESLGSLKEGVYRNLLLQQARLVGS